MFDTICHEHQEYYRLKEIHWMMKKVGFKIIDVEFNQINGGSFSVAVAKQNFPIQEAPNLAALLAEEENKGLSTSKPYDDFRIRIYEFKSDIRQLLDKLNKEKRLILGYGASTKGNVLLQFCDIGNKDVNYIADRNPLKYNLFTPGTKIKIISENRSRRLKPDYYLVLPWHFKKEILIREKKIRKKGTKFIFPLPNVNIV